MVNILRRIYLSNSDQQAAGHVGNDVQPLNLPNQQDALVNSDNNSGQETPIVTSTEHHISKKRGRGPTKNTKFAKKKAKGKELDIQFPPPYNKVCGKHASLFKAEVTSCVRQHAPFRVTSWKEISENEVKTLWLILKDKFNFSDDVYPYVMKQVQAQYKSRQYHLYRRYLKSNECPNDVDSNDWEWLIANKWSTNKFKAQSDRNKVNRGHQQIGSMVGTKSIIQKAYEMKDKNSDEWPDAVTLWKATHMKHNGTWSVPNGEEIMNKLQEEGEKNQEKILSAPILLVEHFGLVLGTMSNYSRGIGVGGITSSSQVKSRILAETEAAKRRAESEVTRLTEISKKQEETNIELQKNIAAQREELIAQGKAIEKQSMELQQVRELFTRLAGEQLVSNLFPNASQSNSATSDENA